MIALLALLQSRPTAPAESGLAFITVPEGFMVKDVVRAGLLAYPMFANFDDRGRLLVAESSGKDIRGAAMAEFPECRIRLLEDTDGDGVFDSSTVFADKVGIPMGVLFHQGAVYVASPPDVLRFEDTDHDGIADRREALLSGWHVRGTASLHGPFLGPDGWLYLTDGRHGFDIKTKEGTQFKGLAARVWRLRPDGTGLASYAGSGCDNPVELAFDPAGELFSTMTYFTNPRLGERDGLLHVLDGAVYAKFHLCVDEFQLTGELMPPMTKFARIAPAGLHRYRGVQLGDGYHGNLFSAQFNTHRIQRHVLAPTNATFQTTDSDFLVSSHPDFHPTDVLEDAEGRLLVVDTGGWYVDQCPLSRISKPEFRGGIYRVERIGVRAPADPRGDGILWREQTPAQLADRLTDPRPVVRDRAGDALVAMGPKAVREVARFRETTHSVEARCAAVWILFRLGDVEARAALVRALDDPHPAVRVAALKAIGLNADSPALDRIHQLLAGDLPAVRREAATALGRIGDTRSNGPLIQAADRAQDRFEEHAIIRALTLNYSQLAGRRIQSSATQLGRLAPGGIRAALIAFDQMQGSSLRPEHVIPFLDHPDERVRETAVWVFTRHADWATAIVSHLRQRLNARKLVATDLDALRRLFAAGSHNADVQKLMADAVADAKLGHLRHAVVFEVMQGSDLPKFPGVWIGALKFGLAHTNDTIRATSMQTVEARALPGFTEFLEQIADTDAREDLRFKAFGVLARQNLLKNKQIESLIDLLHRDAPASHRASAAAVLGQARLINSQLLTIAKGGLPEVEPVLLPTLLEAYRGSTNALVGKTLVETLLGLGRTHDYLNSRALKELLGTFPDEVRAQGDILVSQVERAHAGRLGRLKELESLLGGGDVGRGRHVFFGQKAQCGACHEIGGEGGTLGPDLTTIGKIRSGLDILEAIVFPSASFVPGYEPMKIVTKDEAHTGNIAEETKESVVLKVNATTQLRLNRKDIKSITPGEVSVMPAGLDLALGRDELRDLLTFLQSLNGEQWLQPQVLGSNIRVRQPTPPKPAAKPAPKPAPKPAATAP